MTIRSVLDQDAKAENQYDKDMGKWGRDGRVGEPPPLPQTQEPRLAQILKDILGYEVSFIKDSMSENLIEFRDQSGPFFEKDLSDGERQLLMFCFMLSQSYDFKMIFLVDEPELHLNEARAVDVWEQIEANFPHCSFVYATHSLEFATRAAIDELYTVARDREPLEVIRNEDIPINDIRALVGARIQLRRSSKNPVVCEDLNMAKLVALLLDVSSFHVVPLTNGRSVREAVKRNPFYGQLFHGYVQCCGIIDRDQYDDDTIDGLITENVFALPFNETESVLMVPNIAADYLSAAKQEEVASNIVKEILVEAASKNLHHSLTKVKDHIRWRFRPQISFESRQNSVSSIVIDFDKSTVSETFRQAAQKLCDAIEARDVDSILRLFDGKVLYHEFAREVQRVLNIKIPVSSQQLADFLAQANSRQLVLSHPGLGALKEQVVSYFESNRH